MFALMYVAQRQSHLTPVSISELSHMLPRLGQYFHTHWQEQKPAWAFPLGLQCVCVIWFFIPFPFGQWFLCVYTFVAVGQSFSSAGRFLFGSPFWLHLNQLVAVLCLHISTSFGSSNVHFYDACGESLVALDENLSAFRLVSSPRAYSLFYFFILFFSGRRKSLFISNYTFIVLKSLRTL